MSTLEHVRSPEAYAGPGPVGTLAAQVRAEVIRYRRLPEYVVGVVVLPVILFAMFGLPSSDTVLPGGTNVVALLFVSFACYGIVSQALFTFGADLAEERQQGWLRRLRATPMTMGTYFGGKLALSLVYSAVTVAATALLAQWGGAADFDPARLAATVGVLLLGTVCFSPMGAAIAYWARPRAVSTIVNLVFLPLSFLSGFFFPLSQLPDVLQSVAPWLPTYHFGQLAWGTMAPSEDLALFGVTADGRTLLHVGVVLGWAVLCTALTAVGYRRELDRERS